MALCLRQERNGQSLRRWSALIVLNVATAMIVVDGTIVNVALPAMRADLAFSDSALVWVVNAYVLAFASFLVLGGRLGDLFGPRRLFLFGVTFFAGASFACGVSSSREALIMARAFQGLGGALVSATALSLTLHLFTELAERAKALAIFGLFAASGGCLGLLLGGVLTTALNWHWIFLVNLPIAAAVVALGLIVLPDQRVAVPTGPIDIAGAITSVAAIILVSLAVQSGGKEGSGASSPVALSAAAAMLVLLFLAIESRAAAPLVPLRLFAARNWVVACILGMLLSAAVGAWYFVLPLYLQLAFGYGALQIALALVPASVTIAVFSVIVSARVLVHFGIKPPLVTGLLSVMAGLILFVRAPVSAHLVSDVLPGMLLLAAGSSLACSAILLAAMADIAPQETGLASGIVNANWMMGGAFGSALAISAAAARTAGLTASGRGVVPALNGGYHLAFLIGAAFAAAAALLGATALLPDPGHAPRRSTAVTETHHT